MPQDKKNYAFILTTRARYDRVLCIRVLRSQSHHTDNGYQVTYDKIGKNNIVRTVTEFIPDKWIVHMYKYAS